MSNYPAKHRELCLRTLAMPADTNPNGDIFGGWILGQMDLAGGNFAYKISRGRVVTVGIEAMSFHLPISIGDEVSCYCELAKKGNTSLKIHIETWIRRLHEETLTKVTEGVFTYVAIDEKGNKRQLP